MAQKNVKKDLKSKQKLSKEKEKYFDYYDDIKDKTHRVVDW